MSTRNETIKVAGMSCQHCVKAIKDNINKISGINSVDVNLENGTVAVSFEEGTTHLEAIEGAIVGAGYDVVKNK